MPSTYRGAWAPGAGLAGSGTWRAEGGSRRRRRCRGGNGTWRTCACVLEIQIRSIIPAVIPYIHRDGGPSFMRARLLATSHSLPTGSPGPNSRPRVASPGGSAGRRAHARPGPGPHPGAAVAPLGAAAAAAAPVAVAWLLPSCRMCMCRSESQQIAPTPSDSSDRNQSVSIDTFNQVLAANV